MFVSTITWADLSLMMDVSLGELGGDYAQVFAGKLTIKHLSEAESRTDIVELMHFEKSVSSHHFSSLSASVR